MEKFPELREKSLHFQAIINCSLNTEGTRLISKHTAVNMSQVEKSIKMAAIYGIQIKSFHF